MRKAWISLLLAMTLLFSGCSAAPTGAPGGFEALFTTTETSLNDGHFFFDGIVLSVETEDRQISYYEAQMGKNTFYQVQVADDYEGCLPGEVVTVCVLGNYESFPNRETLKKGEEYQFDTALWVQGDQVVFLLPTFYTTLPARRGDQLYAGAEGKLQAVGTYAHYREELRARMEQTGYGPATVLAGVKESLQNAVEKNAQYFEALQFTDMDAAALNTTAQNAAARLQRANEALETWEGIKTILV